MIILSTPHWIFSQQGPVLMTKAALICFFLLLMLFFFLFPFDYYLYLGTTDVSPVRGQGNNTQMNSWLILMPRFGAFLHLRVCTAHFNLHEWRTGAVCTGICPCQELCGATSVSNLRYGEGWVGWGWELMGLWGRGCLCSEMGGIKTAQSELEMGGRKSTAPGLG